MKAIIYGNMEANINFLKRYSRLLYNKKILEIGCGAGHMTSYLHKQGYDITGIDIEDIFNYSIQRGIPKKTFAKMDAEKLDFAEDSFDVVLSFDLLEHLHNPKKHLSEVKRVLRKKGHYLLQTPNKYTNLPFEVLKNKSLKRHKRYHPSLQSAYSLRKLLLRNGFRCRFVRVDVRSKFLRKKLVKTLGFLGWIISKIPFHLLPTPLQTNFYVVAKLIK